MKKRKNRRKNPEQEQFVKQLLKNSDDYQFLGEGAFGEAWYFIIGENLQIGTKILYPGEYVIKLFYVALEERHIKYLQRLSNEKLISNHYILTRYFVIMDFIDGQALRFWAKNNNHETRQKIYPLIVNKVQEWHSKGFAHEDLYPDHDNILIDKYRNVFFIDPSLEDVRHPNFEMDLVALNEIKFLLNWGKLR